MRGAGFGGAVIGLMLLCLPAWGARPPTPPRAQAVSTSRPAFHAVRTDDPPTIDGKLDDPAWASAEVYSNFVVSYPKEGATPSQRTDVRVLYDDQALYVGIFCHDAHPEQILRRLGRRDQMPTSDLVTVGIDSHHDRRSAYAFQVNAAGVREDILLYDDTSSNGSWNAVWNAAVSSGPEGWSVEMALPLSIFSFSAAPTQVWGFAVERQIPRTHEQIDSVLLPRSANAAVSLYGDLVGLTDLHARTDLEITPYVAARAGHRPRYAASDRPQPRVWDPSVDFGFNLKSQLTTNLTLNAAFNPDFGEVQADQLVLNLSNFETYYGELRPFFTEGLDLFEPVNGGERLFYSRRIGLTAPILGAAKLTGRVGKGWSLGVLDAVVAGAADPAKSAYAYSGEGTDSAALDRSWHFHPMQPFHFGPNDALPGARPVPENFLAAVGRLRLSQEAIFKATVTAANPLGPRCTRADFASDEAYAEAACASDGGYGGALSWDLRTRSGDWILQGQVSASERSGGPKSGWTRVDGTHLPPGSFGEGATVRAGKVGGAPWQFNVRYLYESPTLDLNPSGFQNDWNEHLWTFYGEYTRPNGFGPFHSFYTDVSGWHERSSDGAFTPRGGGLSGDISFTLPSFDSIGLNYGWDHPQFDIREISGTGIPFQRRDDLFLALFGGTDSNRPVSLSGDAGIISFLRGGPVRQQWGWLADLSLNLRPSPSIEVSLAASAAQKPQGARYIEALGGGHYLFGALNPGLLSLTSSVSWVITPELTLQGYAQLFGAFGQYDAFFEGSSDGRAPIRMSALVPTPYAGDPDFHQGALDLNLVLRWEYRPGSTLFVVYSRAQNELAQLPGAPVSHGFLPDGLGNGRATDTFLVKWSYWWSI